MAFIAGQQTLIDLGLPEPATRHKRRPPVLDDPTLLACPPAHERAALLTWIARFDLIAVMSSAGKDSQAMLAHVVKLATAAGALHRVVVIHNDLGVTDSGIPVEWPGTGTLARLQADHYGLPFHVTRRELGGLYQEIQARGYWPSSGARYCTSDQKTAQAKKVIIRLCDALAVTGRRACVLYCLGIRAQESRARALRPAVAFDPSASTHTSRTVIRWHPIHDLSDEQVWAEIHASGVPYHPAYDWGMTRLSCSACVLSSKPDLIRAARLRPALFAEYLATEERFTADPHPKRRELAKFQANRSMADLITAAQRAVPLAFACNLPDCPTPPVRIVHDVPDPYDPPMCVLHSDTPRLRLITA